MDTRKVIIVDPIIEKALDNVFNAALKHEGLPLVSSINTVRCSIIEEPMDDELFDNQE